MFNDCSSSSVPETPSQLDSWRNFWNLQPKNVGGNLFSFDAAIDGGVETQLLWCWKLPVLIKYNVCVFSALRYSLYHLALAYCRRESSSLFFVGFIIVVLWPVTLAIYSNLFELTIFDFFSLLTVVFLALWFPNFFLTFFKASTSYGYFHCVSYGIFAHWFSLNQMFKFSVSFATEVEKNRPSHGQCFNRGLRSTKDLNRATGHLSRPTKNVRDLKSLLLSWKTCILIHLNAWKV